MFGSPGWAVLIGILSQETQIWFGCSGWAVHIGILGLETQIWSGALAATWAAGVC